MDYYHFRNTHLTEQLTKVNVYWIFNFNNLIFKTKVRRTGCNLRIQGLNLCLCRWYGSPDLLLTNTDVNDNRMKFLGNHLFTCTPDMLPFRSKSQGLWWYLTYFVLKPTIGYSFLLTSIMLQYVHFVFILIIVSYCNMAALPPLQGCGWVMWVNIKQTFLLYMVLHWLKSKVSHLDLNSAVFKIKC